MTEDEMVEWHHRLHGHEFGQPPGDGEGQGSLACCSPRGHKESDTTEPQNNQVENDCTAQGVQPVLCDGPEGWREGMCVHTQLIQLVGQRKPAQHCKAIILQIIVIDLKSLQIKTKNKITI